MVDPTQPTPEALESQRAELRKKLENLNAMAEEGIPVAEAQTKVRQRLTVLEERHRALESSTKPVSTFDQSGQRVDTQVNIANLFQVYQSAPGCAKLSEEEFQDVLSDYLEWVKREYGYTRLHGLRTLQETGSLNRPLSDVYTSLAVSHRPAVVPGGDPRMGRQPGRHGLEGQTAFSEPKPVDMADLLTLGERVAIVGGAGSGKTTYLSFVAASLAAALQGEALDFRLKSPAKATSLPVPLFAPLRFWQVYRDEVNRVPGIRIIHDPDAGSLGAFLLWFLRMRYKNFEATGDFFDRLLRGKRGCLFLLDGLDEVVSVDERRTVRDGVDRLLQTQFPDNPCLVTAREAGYRDAPFGSDFVRCDIQPMNGGNSGTPCTFIVYSPKAVPTDHRYFFTSRGRFQID